VDWYLKVLKKYAVFSGRACRREYWTFIVINVLIAVLLGIIEGFLTSGSKTPSNWLATIYQLAIVIPTIAVGVRRMHDTNHSGWWLIVGILNLVFALSAGTRGENRFGPDPKAVASSVSSASRRNNQAA
jgi:uncharacterized membrane protein YhaH (DUF805 family)